MAEPTRAVFLSYASQDAEAARRICEALRATGMEVWFDQSELRGGDAWDQMIRRQIHECALFVPVISSNTQARLEGYFRREWKLAADRTYDMAVGKPFLVPVVIDETKDQDAEVPESFRAVQWTRLPGAETPSEFVQRVSYLLSPGVHVAPMSVSAASRRRTSWRSRLALLLMVSTTVIAVGYFVADKLWMSKRTPYAGRMSPPTAQLVSSAQTTIAEKSVAVLPFVDMTEKHDQEYFSDGLSEELIDQLARNPNLKVIARTSSFQFKGKNEDIRSVAAKLGVANLLEGSVRKAGNRIRITAQLIRADNGYHLWSQSYDRRLGDIFRVQDDIARAVVTALQVTLLKESPTNQPVPRSIAAYNLVLEGRYFARRASSSDPSNMAHAIELFQQAVTPDATYAPAWSGMAYAYAWMAAYGSGKRMTESLRLARAASDRALAFDPNLSTAHTAAAYIHFWFDFDWQATGKEYQRALALDPGNSDARLGLAVLELNLWHLETATETLQQLLIRDPLLPEAYHWLGRIQDAQGHAKQAETALRRCALLKGQPEAYELGWHLLKTGHPAVALEGYKRLPNEIYRLTGIAIASYAIGQKQASDDALAVLTRKYATEGAYQIASVHDARNELDQCFQWLDRAYAQHDPGLTGLKFDSYAGFIFRNAKVDSRYRELLRKLKLLD